MSTMFRGDNGEMYSKCRTGIPVFAPRVSDAELYRLEHQELRLKLDECRAALRTIADRTFPDSEDPFVYHQELAQTFLGIVLLAEVTCNKTQMEEE